MDPVACLLAAKDAILDGRIDEAQGYVDDYLAWRLFKGGFEPEVKLMDMYVRGDDYVKTLQWAIDRNLAEDK